MVNDQPKRARMIGRLIGGVFISRHSGKQRRCFCPECRNARSSRAKEKKTWKR